MVFTIFGILILLLTQEAIKALLVYIGIGMLVVGAILLIFGINSIRRDKAAAMLLIESIVSIGIGISLAFFPEVSVALFLILTGIWAIIIGIIQLVILINVPNEMSSKNLLMINGILTIALGIALLFNPFQWLALLVKLIGVLAAVFGIMIIYFAFLLRSVKTE